MPTSPPPLRPREHGAYAMLSSPVASGLLLGGPSLAGGAFALLAVAGFLAHESALVVLGRRGERVRSSADAAARRRLAVLGGVGAAAGGAFVVAAPSAALAWAIAPALLGAVVMGLALARGTKSLPAELLVAAAFASVHGAVAASGRGALPWAPGAEPSAQAVGVPVLVWAASFALATLSVHALKVRFRGKGERGRGAGWWVVAAAPAAAGAVLAAGVGAFTVGHPLTAPAGALVPKALLVLAVAALDVHPRHLKRVGWGLVAADTATLVTLVAAV